MREEHSVVICTGRGKCVVTPEGVGTIPKNWQAAVAVFAELDTIEGGYRTSGPPPVEITASSSDENSDSLSDRSSNSREVALDSPRSDNSSPGRVLRSTVRISCDADRNAEVKQRGEIAVEAKSTTGAASTEEKEVVISDTAFIEVASPLRLSGRAVKPIERLNLVPDPIDRDAVAQATLKLAHDALGNAQFMSKELRCTPYWLHQEAQDAELGSNWLPNMRRLQCTAVPD